MCLKLFSQKVLFVWGGYAIMGTLKCRQYALCSFARFSLAYFLLDFVRILRIKVLISKRTDERKCNGSERKNMLFLLG